MTRDSSETLDDTFVSSRSETSLTKLGRLGEKGEVRTVDPSEKLKVCYDCDRRAREDLVCGLG